MGTFSRHRSYTEKVLLARKRRKTLVRIVLFLIILALVRSFLLQSYLLEDDAMAPSFVKNDRVFVTPLPYGPMFCGLKLPAIAQPKRGDVVLIRQDPSPFQGGVSQIFRAFSSHYSLARVIGQPGDSVVRQNSDTSYFSIRPLNQDAYQEELTASGKPYAITECRASVDCQALESIFPTGQTVRLAPNEFFVAFDNRNTLSGSMVWGPVHKDEIAGKVFFIYWPLSRVGLR